MYNKLIRAALLALLPAVALLALGHTGQIWLLIAVVAAAEVAWLWQRKALSAEGVLETAPTLAVSLAAGLAMMAAGRIGASGSLESHELWLRQGLIAALYAGWLFWWQGWGRLQSDRVAGALSIETAGLWAVFLAATLGLWRGPWLPVASWLVSFAAAHFLLKEASSRTRNALAAAWALIVAECAWIFGLWQVSYVLGGGLLVIPQAVVVIGFLSYCFGNIYLAHAGGGLSRARLAEYLIIGLALLSIVIAGTPWRGTL